MDYIIPPINMNMISQNNAVNPYPSDSRIGSEFASEQLTSFFLKNMLKQIMKNESNEMFSGISNTAFMPEIFMDKVIEDLTKSDAFGINKIFADQLRSKGAQ